MTEVRIPQASMEMTEGSIDEWLVSDGDSVTEGQPIYTLETDKVVMEVEAPTSGVVRIIGAAGGNFAVGDLVATIS